MKQPRSIIIIGGGPSGIAAALEAVRHGASPVVLERLDRVGGLARTLAHAGNRFDIGPHRFFTFNPEVRQLFADILGDDLVRVPRLTRIYYRNKFFDYPLTPLNALFGLGIVSSIRIFVSYLAARLRRWFASPTILSFEDWIVDRFGRRLYETFFKTYTEKVWGISCQRIGADWAAQRIKGLSLTRAVWNALFHPKKKVIKTLVDEFVYPRLGAGQFYEKMETIVASRGGDIRKRTEVTKLMREGDRVVVAVYRNADGGEGRLAGDFFLSSAPLTELVAQIDPPPPAEILAAARGLRYRSHIGVKLVIEGEPPFPDNWIYVHSPEVRMARVSNYRNFSKEMGASTACNPITVEYFCFPGDEIWESSDAALIARAVAELETMGIASGRISGAFVVRSEKAYPVIEIGFQEKVETIRSYLGRFENLLPIGRSGMFKYNNQDHAIATGLYAARTALGLGDFDPWLVNIDAVYQEGTEIAADPSPAPSAVEERPASVGAAGPAAAPI